MLNAIKEQRGDTLIVRLKGSLDETSRLDVLFGHPPKKLIINCKEVERINSSGVKVWIKYFTELSKQGVELTFTECAPPIVEQINLILNFSCGGTVESVFLPYCCDGCKRVFIILVAVQVLKTIYQNLPVNKCPACGGKVLFDEIESEYFAFLKR